MTEPEAIAIIDSWDLIQAAMVLKAYEAGDLLRPEDVRMSVDLECEDLRAELRSLYELLVTALPPSAAREDALRRVRDRLSAVGVTL